MAEKTFFIDTRDGSVTPATLRVSILGGDVVYWTINSGAAVVAFDPDRATPVAYIRGPAVSPPAPACGYPQVIGKHPHRVLYEVPGKKKFREVSITPVLIIDP